MRQKDVTTISSFKYHYKEQSLQFFTTYKRFKLEIWNKFCHSFFLRHSISIFRSLPLWLFQWHQIGVSCAAVWLVEAFCSFCLYQNSDNIYWKKLRQKFKLKKPKVSNLLVQFRSNVTKLMFHLHRCNFQYIENAINTWTFTSHSGLEMGLRLPYKPIGVMKLG